MPTVRRYGTRQVATRPIAGTPQTAAATPESLGAGLAQQQAETAEAFGNVARQGAGLAVREYDDMRRRFYEQQLRDVDLETDNQLALTQRQLEEEVLGAKGDQVKGVRDSVLERFRKRAAELEAGLSNEQQRYNFATRRAQREQGLDATAMRHTSQQLEVSRKAESVAGIENARYNVQVHALDPGFRVESEIARAMEITRADAERLGLPAETRTANERAVRSTLITDYITALLAAGATTQAQTAWDATKDHIVGPQRDNLQEAVKAGTVLGEAQQVSRSIAAETEASLSTWIEKAEARDLRPEVLEETKRLLKEKDALREREQREAEERDSLAIANWIDTTPTIGLSRATLQLRPEWSRTAPGTRAGLLGYLEHKVKGVAVPTDYGTYQDLMDLLAHDDEAFAKLDLRSKRGKLDDAAYDYFSRTQLALRKGGQEAAAARRAATIDTELFNTIAHDAGLKPYETKRTAEDRARLGQLRNRVEQAIADEQGKLKRLLGREEKQKIMEAELDDLVMLDVTGFDVSVPAAVVLAGEVEKAYVPIKRIPETLLVEYENWLRSELATKAPTPRQADFILKQERGAFRDLYRGRLERAYAAHVMRRGEDTVKRILEGKY